MLSDRVQRQIDRLLDEAEQAITQDDWSTVRQRAQAALRMDPGNRDALAYLAAAERDPITAAAATPSEPAARPGADSPASSAATAEAPGAPRPEAAQPTSLGGGRYEVKRFLGEGGKKRVYLAHDTL